MKRRASQERDEADARTQADARREKLLAQLRDRETSARDTPVPPVPDAAPPEPGSDAEPPAGAGAVTSTEADPGKSADEASG